MSALNHLALLLRPGVDEGAREMTTVKSINTLVDQMEARAKSSGSRQVAEDHQLEALRRFWQSHEIGSFRDAYLLSGGLCLQHPLSGSRLIEDGHRFRRVLEGVDGWTARPKAYRWCYKGLVKCYFTYDAGADAAPSTGRNNWEQLRGYLHDRNNLIRDKQVNPDWVAIAIENRHLFSENPCAPYVDAWLRGDDGAIDHLCEQLGISKASWFLRDLVLARVRGAIKLGHAEFQEHIPRLLALLAGNEVLRDRGLVLILDRYTKVPSAHLHQGLRDSSVLWWGNPWLSSNETRWGGVTPEARAMVADWLKLEFIETFFTKLAEDGLGDRRRMEFWKRYVKAINHIEFALGSNARYSRERDFVALRKKMTGLIRELDSIGTSNAFIMTMGNLVAVEFSGMGNALYGYDAGTDVPFDTAKPLKVTVNARNSLKNKDCSMLRLLHKDDIHNWDKWEQMFEATLREEYGIEPAKSAPALARARTGVASPPPTPRPRPSNNEAWHKAAEATLPYSRSALTKFANARGLQIEDKTTHGGSLWVRAGADDPHIARMLDRWGFRHKAGKGWWK